LNLQGFEYIRKIEKQIKCHWAESPVVAQRCGAARPRTAPAMACACGRVMDHDYGSLWLWPGRKWHARRRGGAAARPAALAAAPAAMHQCQAAADPARRHHNGRRECHAGLTSSEQRHGDEEGRRRRRGCRRRPQWKWRGVRWPATRACSDGREVSTVAKAERK
jgi:hypothetical protein